MIRIGTNFSYNGRQYLDDRQGLADNAQDLLGWDILVPEGFEVFMGGTWYAYDSNYNSPLTGHFKLRPGFEEYNELANEVFPLSYSSFSGGGTFEIGKTDVLPKIDWELERKGEPVSPISSTVNGSTDGVNRETLLSFVSPVYISENTNYIVQSIIGTGAKATRTASYNFYYKKYYGVSANESLTNEEILALSSTWATSWTMSDTVFDCTGGKYPYYIIPSELYSESTFKVWIGGLRNTDLVISDQDVTNSYGISHLYKIIRLGTLQRGVLSIKFSS